MAFTVQPGYWSYSTPAPPTGYPPPVVTTLPQDYWLPSAPTGNATYNYAFPPAPWSASSWSAALPTYPVNSYGFSPVDYTLSRQQFPDTVMTPLAVVPSFPSVGFYSSDSDWTQRMTEESTREAADLEKQRQDSLAVAQTTWNRNWKDYSELLGKQLELDGKPLKG